MRASLGTILLCLTLALLSVACGPRPLEGVGARSGEWIGPVVHGVEFLPRTRSSQPASEPAASPLDASASPRSGGPVGG